jgi:hypothetical protein
MLDVASWLDFWFPDLVWSIDAVENRPLWQPGEVLTLRLANEQEIAMWDDEDREKTPYLCDGWKVMPPLTGATYRRNERQ